MQVSRQRQRKIGRKDIVKTMCDAMCNENMYCRRNAHVTWCIESKCKYARSQSRSEFSMRRKCIPSSNIPQLAPCKLYPPVHYVVSHMPTKLVAFRTNRWIRMQQQLNSSFPLSSIFASFAFALVRRPLWLRV